MGATYHALRRALAANSTADSWTAKTTTLVQPSGVGVFDLFASSVRLAAEERGPKFIDLLPFGANAADEAFSLRLWGWNPTSDSEPVWVPRLLAELTVTLGDIAATALTAGNFLADTIVAAAGDTEAPVLSPANNTPGSAIIHLRGVQVIEFDFNIDTAASANCLWRTLDQD